jgi:hypothetical protein
MTYRIREVDPSDEEVLEELKGLHAATFGSTAPQPDYEKGYWWFAHHSSGPYPIGFAGLEQSSKWANVGYLSRCGVVWNHIGHGLQQRFIRVRERKARALGWELLRSDCTNNIQSANNLIRAGYVLFEPKDPWGPAKDTLYWRKELV